VKQHLLNFLTLTSLLLCAAVLVLWARSYRACDALVRPARAGDRYCVTSEFGMLVVEWEGPAQGTVLEGWEYFQSPLPRRWPVRSRPLGFEAYRGQVTHFVRLPPSTVHGVAVPHWFAAALLAVLPAAWVVRRERARLARRRADGGLCPECGYDLRATTDRCPECGTLRANSNSAS
jgi:hypothetical protein